VVEGAGDVEDAQKIVIPVEGVDIEEEGARGITDVGDVQSAGGEVPRQPAVDGAAGEFAGNGALAGAGDVIEEPGELGAGEVGIEDEAGLFGEERLQSFVAQSFTERGGAAVLPDDSVVKGEAAATLPEKDGFALVGDADGGNVGRRQPRLGESFDRDAELAAPDLAAVMLDPSRLRKDLGEFPLRQRADADLLVEDDGAGTGRPLIKSKDVRHNGLRK